MSYSLDQKSMGFISYFENISGAQVDDCISEDARIIFIVKKGQAGLAIGKKGANIKKAMRDLKKEIEIIENGDTAQEFIKNALAPAEIQEITISEGRAMVKIDASQRGMAIGKGGSKIDRCRKLLQRHFNIDEVILTKM
nr:NusA-like transcription termination signal-binding factor [Candidatus Sigynarchaeum springense]MDO8117382.1 NusA-like transcription termination signal-binding factor [Candidatus Sigynarchaeota archaeon]